MKRAVISPKKGVHHEVVEKAETDREQQEISEQRFDHDRRSQWLLRTQQRDARGDQPKDQEGQGEVAQGEANGGCHASSRRFLADQTRPWGFRALTLR
jgi:hypothetical protein